MLIRHARRPHARTPWTFIAGLLATPLAVLAVAATCQAGEPDPKGIYFCLRSMPETPEQLVQATLRAEARGEVVQRSAELEAMWDTLGQTSAARWYSGFVQQGKQWVPFEQLASLANQNRANAAYEKLREQLMNGPIGASVHLQMADWCAKHQQLDRAAFHLRRILVIDPENAVARSRLGFTKQNGQWIAAVNPVHAQKEAAERARLVNKWQPRLTALRRTVARLPSAVKPQELIPADNADGVAIMEKVFFGTPGKHGTAVIEAWSQMNTPAATEAIARQALLCDVAEVQDLAMEKLRAKPRSTVMPYMLGQLQMGWAQRSFTIETGRDGTLLETEVRARGGQLNDELVCREVLYRGTTPLKIAAVEQELLRSRRQIALNHENDLIRDKNHRVRNVLAEFLQLESGHELRRGEAVAWWDWWNEQLDMTPSIRRPVRQQTARWTAQIDSAFRVASVQPGGFDSVEIPAFDFDAPPEQQYESWVQLRRSCECFVAGTPVWTEHGPLPIEKVRPGDRVLAQNVETGALTLQIVEERTLRDPEPLLRLKLDNDTLVCTRGHLFWIAGRGWTSAADLVPGDRLFTARGNAMLKQVDPASSEKTYNLVVAEVSTYFVGKQAVLSHDVTAERPTAMLVPGVMRQLNSDN